MLLDGGTACRRQLGFLMHAASPFQRRAARAPVYAGAAAAAAVATATAALGSGSGSSSSGGGLAVAACEAVCCSPPSDDSSSAQWSAVIERVVPAIVSLRVCAPMSFDTEGAGCSVATGFVVDAQRGLILTNRHVVHQGPVTAEAVFQNNEEVPVYQVYSDPIHDFGIFRFDPKAVRHMTIGELELAPDAAVVGAEIRVVGNDAATWCRDI